VRRGASLLGSSLLLVAVAVAVAACGSDPSSGSPSSGAGGGGGGILVAAASDLRPAFEELGERFTADTGTPITFDFGSSGQLAQRIIEGQPVDVFASADVGFVERVLAAGIGDASTQRTYASGRLVIWSSRERWAGWEDLTALAADDGVTHLAIANPEHAPYGMAAAEALAAIDALDAVRDRLVFGENVSDTQRLIETGNADVGIVALSLAVAADERGVGRWVPVDTSLHAPLQQDLVVTSTDEDRAGAARAFADLVAGDTGREVLRRYGFLLPGEETG
jgi:molybdate transport system substrate-binding protein